MNQNEKGVAATAKDADGWASDHVLIDRVLGGRGYMNIEHPTSNQRP